MRTLTYQEMMFVGGGKEEISEPPPKAEQSPDPSQDDVIVAFASCAVATWAAKRVPNRRNASIAVSTCLDAAMKAAEYLENRGRRKGK